MMLRKPESVSQETPEHINGTSARVRRRPVSLPLDEEFLKELYASTRDDLTKLPLPREQKDLLIAMQYDAQYLQYSRDFPGARHDILLVDEVPVGRLMVDEGGDRYWIIDVAILPGFRGQGIGSAVIAAEQESASLAAKPLCLQVLMTNSAVGLYERLGFRVTGRSQTHIAMEWIPSAQQPSELGDRSDAC